MRNRRNRWRRGSLAKRRVRIASTARTARIGDGNKGSRPGKKQEGGGRYHSLKRRS
jgi:hypothetical protein